MHLCVCVHSSVVTRVQVAWYVLTRFNGTVFNMLPQ